MPSRLRLVGSTFPESGTGNLQAEAVPMLASTSQAPSGLTAKSLGRPMCAFRAGFGRRTRVVRRQDPQSRRPDPFAATIPGRRAAGHPGHAIPRPRATAPRAEACREATSQRITPPRRGCRCNLPRGSCRPRLKVAPHDIPPSFTVQGVVSSRLHPATSHSTTPPRRHVLSGRDGLAVGLKATLVTEPSLTSSGDGRSRSPRASKSTAPPCRRRCTPQRSCRPARRPRS